MNTLYLIFNWILCLCFNIYKYFLHIITRKCSLLRIMHSYNLKAHKYILIENNLKNSKHLRKIDWYTKKSENEKKETILQIIKCKNVKDVYHEEFSYYLGNVFDLIYCYNSLINEITSLKNEKVESGNGEHRNLLISLWTNIKPSEKLDEKFVSKQWTKVGFQGNDPVTDFRGMGLLGLIQLEHFSKTCPSDVDQILDRSRDFNLGYPLAIASINLTALLFSLLVKHELKLYFYSLPNCSEINLATFNKLFVIVFKRFQQRWLREKVGVMQFNVVKEKFGTDLSIQLNDEASLYEFIDIDSGQISGDCSI